MKKNTTCPCTPCTVLNVFFFFIKHLELDRPHGVRVKKKKKGFMFSQQATLRNTYFEQSEKPAPCARREC